MVLLLKAVLFSAAMPECVLLQCCAVRMLLVCRQYTVDIGFVSLEYIHTGTLVRVYST